MPINQAFRKYFPKNTSELQKVFVPYRVCPIGAHIDHQHGIVTGFALDKGVELCYAQTDDETVEIISLQFDGKAEFTLSSFPEKNNFWGDYACAAVWAMQQAGHRLEKGFCGVISGELSAGGLSSSAAVLICYIKALCKINGITLSSDDLIKTAQNAEKNYVGLNCGTLDQSCEVLCEENRLLVLDTQSGIYVNKTPPQNMPEFEIGVFFSGLTRSLVSSKYNMRTQELLSAFNALKKMSGLETEYSVLREIPPEVFAEHKHALPENERLRCEHFYGEMNRVRQGVKAFENGDIKQFGEYIFASGESSVENFEAGSTELIYLFNILKETPGIHGARFSGAGFKGCCMAIIDPAFKEEIRKNVTQKYCSEFPHLKDKFSIHFCKTANGCAAAESDS